MLRTVASENELVEAFRLCTASSFSLDTNMPQKGDRDRACARALSDQGCQECAVMTQNGVDVSAHPTLLRSRRMNRELFCGLYKGLQHHHCLLQACGPGGQDLQPGNSTTA